MPRANAAQDKFFGPVKVKINEDGSLHNPRFELSAILRADRFVPNDAWRIATEMHTGKSSMTIDETNPAYRDRVFRDPPYKGRVSMLEIERDSFEQDDLFGEVTWSAKQLYRMAMAKGDISNVSKAVSMLMDIVKMKSERGKTEDGEKRGPGRPAVGSGPKAVDIKKLSKDLIDRGVPQPTKMGEIVEEIEFE